MTTGRLAAAADDLLDPGPHVAELDPERGQGRRRDAVALVDQAEEEVLGPDVVVVEQARLFLRQHDDPPGPVGEAFEHDKNCPSLRQPPSTSSSSRVRNAGGRRTGSCVPGVTLT